MCAGARLRTQRQDPQTRERVTDRVGADHLVGQTHRCLRQHLTDVGRIDSATRRITLELGVGGAEHEHPLPWQRHRDPAAFHGHDDTRPPFRLRIDEDVDSLAKASHRLADRVFELPDPVDPGTCRIDDEPEPDLDRRLAFAPLNKSRDEPATRPVQSDHARVVDHGRPEIRGGRHRGQNESSVVGLALIENPADAQPIRPQRRDEMLGGSRSDETHPGPTEPAQRPVRENTSGRRHRASGPSAICRQHDRHAAHQVRRDMVHQRAPLALRLPDEREIEHRQVPEAAVDELGRAAGRRSTEVPGVDQGDRQAGARRLESDAAADDAGPDDQQVERAVAKVLPRLRPRCHACLRRRDAVSGHVDGCAPELWSAATRRASERRGSSG